MTREDRKEYNRLLNYARLLLKKADKAFKQKDMVAYNSYISRNGDLCFKARLIEAKYK